MRRLATVGRLRMLDSRIAYVLRHLSSQRHSQSLYATANAQHRYLPVISQTRDKKFGEITFTVDAAQTRRRLLAAIQRIVVAASAEQKSVDAVEGGDDDICIGCRRYYHRHTAGGYHRLVITVAQLARLFTIISRDAYHRTVLGFRKNRIDLFQTRLPVKTVHTRICLNRKTYAPVTRPLRLFSQVSRALCSARAI